MANLGDHAVHNKPPELQLQEEPSKSRENNTKRDADDDDPGLPLRDAKRRLVTDSHDAPAVDAAAAPSGPPIDTTLDRNDDVGVAVEFEGKEQDPDADVHQVQNELGEDGVVELDDEEMAIILSLPDADYKPQTQETRAAYKALLTVISRQLPRDEALDDIAWVANKVLATLKNDRAFKDPADKKVEIEELLNPISTQLFDQLVSIGGHITDYRDADAPAVGAAGPDENESAGSEMGQSTDGAADTSSSGESVDGGKAGNKHDELTLQVLKRQKVQIMREMLDLQKREMEWRKKHHEEETKYRQEEISLRNKDIELRGKEIEARVLAAEVRIMSVDLGKVAPHVKSYYTGMQQQIIERRGFNSPPNS